MFAESQMGMRLALLQCSKGGGFFSFDGFTHSSLKMRWQQIDGR